ncbi:hypothetical protein [Acinetobacter piscicola]|uniref:hypothetical protein n=1 Tax=Acinetobacter piscicola TaxID=2006115 RepID=UPI00101F6562|nr:hypothetical protein [Acinetobacter piscicola]RYL29655.1 hypothetical protein EWP19_02425 [Acinetobacter piscicola]
MTKKYSLWNDLTTRTFKIWDFTFIVSHFFLGIIFFSGLGFWIEVLKFFLPFKNESWINLKLSLIFYPPAVFGSSCIYLLLTKQEKNLQSFMLIFAALMGVITFLLSFNVALDNSLLFWFSNILTIIIALWSWILANSSNPELYGNEESDVDAPSGGSTKAQLAGDTTDFQTED